MYICFWRIFSSNNLYGELPPTYANLTTLKDLWVPKIRHLLYFVLSLSACTSQLINMLLVQLQSNRWYQLHREYTQFHREVDQCSNTVRHPTIIYMLIVMILLWPITCVNQCQNTLWHPNTCWLSWHSKGWLLV